MFEQKKKKDSRDLTEENKLFLEQFLKNVNIANVERNNILFSFNELDKTNEFLFKEKIPLADVFFLVSTNSNLTKNPSFGGAVGYGTAYLVTTGNFINLFIDKIGTRLSNLTIFFYTLSSGQKNINTQNFFCEQAEIIGFYFSGGVICLVLQVLGTHSKLRGIKPNGEVTGIHEVMITDSSNTQSA